jgi:very-short-patch-repair endonuclease
LLALSILKAKKGYLLEDQRLSAFKLSTQELLEQYAADGRTRTSRL